MAECMPAATEAQPPTPVLCRTRMQPIAREATT